MVTITFCTQKGGVSKTTTAEALILYLRRHGYKVLAIDLDNQGNLSTYFNYDPNQKKTVFEFVDGDGDPKEAIVNDLLAGGSRLRYLVSYFDQNELSAFGNALKAAKLDYDVVVIDTPPAINRVVLAALAASDYLIMPTEPSPDSLAGVKETLKAVDAVLIKDNPNLKVLGTLLVKYKDHYKLHKQFKTALESSKTIPMFKTCIRESQGINAAKIKHADFYSKDYSHVNAVVDYREFCKEVIEKIGLKPKEEKK